MIELIGIAVIGWAIKEVAGESKRIKQSREDCARYQSTIDRATAAIGDDGAPNRKRRR